MVGVECKKSELPVKHTLLRGDEQFEVKLTIPLGSRL